MESSDLYNKYNKKECLIALWGRNEINGSIRVDVDSIVIKTFDDTTLCRIQPDEFIKILNKPSFGFRKFYVVEDGDLNVNDIFKKLNNKSCTCKIKGIEKEFKIFVDINKDSIYFKGHKFGLTLQNIKSTINFIVKNNRTFDGRLTNFKIINSMKIKPTTVEEYYNEYNNKLCSFNVVDNGYIKAKILMPQYENGTLHRIILKDIETRDNHSLDFYYFIYLIENGRLLDNAITDFKIIDSIKTKISMKDIADKFKISVDEIEIVK